MLEHWSKHRQQPAAMARHIIRTTKKAAQKALRTGTPVSFTPSVRLTAASSDSQNTSESKKEIYVPRGRQIKNNPNYLIEEPKPNFATTVSKRFAEALSEDKPHFRVGEKSIYFPTAKVVLLRPNAKHTPNQAKFVVPRYFNKLDLRDYLYHVYGLRALNVTTQLLWARWTRETPRSPRFRDTQIKKMTIEMEDPFIWPEEFSEEERGRILKLEFSQQMEKYLDDQNRLGSDKFKPPTSFDGLVGPFPPAPEPFIPKHFKKAAQRAQKVGDDAEQRQIDEELVKKFLKL